MEDRTCLTCSAPVGSSNPNRRYCSQACRERARPRIPCSSCGGPTGYNSSHRGRASVDPICHPCRRAAPGYRESDMARRGIMEEHSCEDCGRSWARLPTKGQRPKRCPACRVDTRRWIPAKVRIDVYERDAWTCGICEERVDRDLVGSKSEWRPSLDHVIPRAKGGSDDPSNLRLAHMWCNAARNDGRSYTDDDFRSVAA